MTVVVLVLLGVALWCLASLPVAVAVGRAFQAGESERSFEDTVRGYDAAGV